MTHCCVTQAGHPTKLLLCVFQCSDGNSAQENSSLKRVAVVEDFFDIIYAMHVEMGAEPGRAPKHAGQKKTYKAVRGRPSALHVAGAESQQCMSKQDAAMREMLFARTDLFNPIIRSSRNLLWEKITA